MNLINHLFFAVLICTATGTGMLLIWRLLRCVFLRINPKLVYVTLRWVCILYILPVGYIAVVPSYQKWIQGGDSIWKSVFAGTDRLSVIMTYAGVIWFLLSCGLAIYRLLDYLCWQRKFEDNTPMDDPEVLAVFYEVCSNLGIPEGKVAISTNVLIDGPMIYGVRHPRILLPEEDYTPEQLRYFFYHELSHYMHRDIICKCLLVWVSILHSFNLFIYVLMNAVNSWSECMADVSALERSGHLYDARPYFDMIMQLIPEEGKNMKKKKFIFSALFESRSELQKRIDFTKIYQKYGKANKVVTFVLSTAFIAMTTVVAFVVGDRVADMHNKIYRETESMLYAYDAVVEDTMVEHCCNMEDLHIDNLKIIESVNQPSSFSLDFIHENWSVDSFTRYISKSYLVSADKEIHVITTTMPKLKSYWVGIIDEDGNVRYVEGTDLIVHKFDITTTNKYRVFVQNNYEDDISDMGISYLFTDQETDDIKMVYN